MNEMKENKSVILIARRFPNNTCGRGVRVYYAAGTLHVNLLMKKIVRRCPIDIHWSIEVPSQGVVQGRSVLKRVYSADQINATPCSVLSQNVTGQEYEGPCV